MEDIINNESIKIWNDAPNEIIFYAHEAWVMKITKDRGILFNKEHNQATTPDDFAKAVIDILERCYTVTFKKKNPPYDRIKYDHK